MNMTTDISKFKLYTYFMNHDCAQCLNGTLNHMKISSLIVICGHRKLHAIYSCDSQIFTTCNKILNFQIAARVQDDISQVA